MLMDISIPDLWQRIGVRTSRLYCQGWIPRARDGPGPVPAAPVLAGVDFLPLRVGMPRGHEVRLQPRRG